MKGNLNQPITLPSFGQIVYQNSGVPGVFNSVPIQQTLTLPIPVPPTPTVQSIPIKTSKRVRIHEDPDEEHKLTTYIDSLLPHEINIQYESIYRMVLVRVQVCHIVMQCFKNNRKTILYVCARAGGVVLIEFQ